MKKIFIGLPCYNEEKDINTLIDRILKVKNDIKIKFELETEIFCVNDGSKDKTEEIIKTRQKDNIYLVNHEHNKGLGEAVKTIIKYFKNKGNKGDFLVIMDADNSHNPQYILNLLEKQRNDKSDVIIASRYQEGAKITGLKRHRIMLSDAAKLWYSKMLKIPNVKDYTCGYRLYTYEIIDKGIKKYDKNIINQSGFACMMELLYKLHSVGAKISEIPFSLEYDKKAGNSKMKIFKTSINSLITTIKIKNDGHIIKNVIPYILILLFTVILMFMSCATLKNVGLKWDAAVYLNVSRNLQQGKVLYKDIVDNKGPVLYFINAIALKVGGQTGVVLFEFMFIYIAFVFMYKSLQLINNNKIINIATLFIIFIYFIRFFTSGLTCEEYGLTFSTIGLYLCLKYYQNNYFTSKQCFTLGALCALTFFIRPNLIIIFVAFGLGIGIKLIIEKNIKELIHYILFSFIGFLFITLLIFIYLVTNNCIYDFIENVFLINITMNKNGVLSSIIDMCYFLPLSFFMMGMYFIISLYKIFKGEKRYFSDIFLIIITILFNSISKEVYCHYFISFFPIMLLVYCNILKIKINKHINYVAYLFVLINIITNVYIILMQNGFYRLQPNKMEISYIINNTTKEDKIAVVGFYDEIYYLTERDSVSKYTYILSNDAFLPKYQINVLNQYFRDIIEKKPKIIVEDNKTLDKTVKKYISIEEYENLKNSCYELKQENGNIKLFELIKKDL